MPLRIASKSTGREVVVVEDDADINRLVGDYVELAGFRYVAALTGAQAMAEISYHLPQAVILDMMLPDVAGMEICRQLKSDPDTRDIPIIVLTAMHNEECRREGIRLGVAEYMSKPFDPDKFLEALTCHAARGVTSK